MSVLQEEAVRNFKRAVYIALVVIGIIATPLQASAQHRPVFAPHPTTQPEFDPEVREFHYYVDDINFTIPTRMVTIVYRDSSSVSVPRTPASACDNEDDITTMQSAVDYLRKDLDARYDEALKGWRISLPSRESRWVLVRWGYLLDPKRAIGSPSPRGPFLLEAGEEYFWICVNAAT